jgi:hypothetical protein
LRRGLVDRSKPHAEWGADLHPHPYLHPIFWAEESLEALWAAERTANQKQSAVSISQLTGETKQIEASNAP